MDIAEHFRYLGWETTITGRSISVELPLKSPVVLSVQALEDGRRLRCHLKDGKTFADLLKAYTLDTCNCPPQTFRAESSFLMTQLPDWVNRKREEEGTSLKEDQKDLTAELDDLAAELKSRSETERSAETMQRKGQDALRKLLIAKFGCKCMATEVPEPDLLVASHIKGWAECKDDTGGERLDIDNVLLLAKNIDALFDRHYISFEPMSGKLVVSKRIAPNTLRSFGIMPDDSGIAIPVPNQRQRTYLEWHLRILNRLDEQA